jgi:prepilin-type N-terminal cleavage/methylation domain-containing protein
MLKIKVNLKPEGFTLVELVIAVGIVAVMMTLVLANFKKFERSAVLDSDAEKLASILRQAQVWSLTGQLRNGARPTGGYGVHVVECSASPCGYQMYADLDASRDYQTGEALATDLYNFSPSVRASVEIDGISTSKIDIIFEPPKSTIYFNGNSSSYTNATIILTHQITGAVKRVRLTLKSGQITFIN